MKTSGKISLLGGLTILTIFITPFGNFDFNFSKVKKENLEKTIVFVSEVGPQPKSYERLDINYESDDYKPEEYAVIKKDEILGISDIRELVNTSLNLESWVYLPYQQLWVEIGGVERIYNLWFDQMDMFFGFPPNLTKTEIKNSDRLEDLLAVNPEISVYSFLPDSKPALDSAIGRGFDPEGKLERAKFEWEMIFNLPSEGVVASMLTRASLFRNTWPDGNITHKICNVYGVFECTLKGIEFEGDLSQFSKNIFDLARFDFSPYFRNPEEALKTACASASDEYVQFSFKTYKELGI